MRFGFFLREALRGLRRSSAPALAALLTVVITALVLGVFIPIVQATTGTANEVRNRVVEAFGDLVFDAVINRTVRFPETTVSGEPITTWAPNSAGAQAYRMLAREVLAR